MKGVFVNWTKPYIERKRLRGYAFKVYREQESDEYMTTDEEILFTILSVGYWKKFNGKTKLYTDKIGLYYYLKNNMLSLWDLFVLWICILSLKKNYLNGSSILK